MNEPNAGQASSLHRANAVAAALHAVQAVAVLLLATDFALPVTASYMAGPTGHTGAPPRGPRHDRTASQEPSWSMTNSG
ncbi:MAG: hypothetical protein ABIW17_09575 [Marmoricola sp.]